MLAVLPERFVPLIIHWYAGAGVPFAVTENDAVAPWMTEEFVGCAVIDGGTSAVTVVTRFVELLPELRSGVAAATVAVFVICPPVVVVAVIVKFVTALAARVVTKQMTSPLLNVQPGDAEENVTEAGSASVMAML